MNSLANITDIFLKNKEISSSASRKDIRGIGLIMIEFIELRTSAFNFSELKVTEPERWADCPDIFFFLADTATYSLGELSNHTFVSVKGDSECFVTYILFAAFNVYIPTDFIYSILN